MEYELDTCGARRHDAMARQWRGSWPRRQSGQSGPSGPHSVSAPSTTGIASGNDTGRPTECSFQQPEMERSGRTRRRQRRRVRATAGRTGGCHHGSRNKRPARGGFQGDEIHRHHLRREILKADFPLTGSQGGISFRFGPSLRHRYAPAHRAGFFAAECVLNSLTQPAFLRVADQHAAPRVHLEKRERPAG